MSDPEEIEALFAELAGPPWDAVAERFAARESRTAYMRDARALDLPSALRWRENERERRRTPEYRAKDRERKRRARAQANR